MESIDNLERYCSSEDLSIDGIKCALGYFVPHDRLHESNFLHRVCMSPNVTLEMIEYLVELFPDMVGTKRERRVEGAYLLHRACANEHCPNSVVKFLMESNIDVLNCICPMCGYSQGLPLHYYLSRRQNVDIEIVKYMVEKYPNALLLVGDSISYTPLHVLLNNSYVGAMLDIVKYLVEYEPMSLRRKDSSYLQQLPLHTACKNQSITKAIIQYLVDKWPEALQEGNYTECTPLHLLCQNGKLISNGGIEILQVILEEYPDGVLQTNRTRVLPTHLAARNSLMSVEFIEILINANRESVGQVDEDGHLPIHYACAEGHIDIVKYLYGLHPDSIRALSSDNELPLNYACCNKDPEVLKYMFGLYPEAIHHRGDSGLPIHSALASSDIIGDHTKEIIEFLVLHDPDCVSKADVYGCLPFHLLCSYDLSYGTALLFDLYPEAILVRDDDGRLPIDVAREYSEDFADEEWYNELITFLRTQQNYALTARDTAAITTPDENGLLPLHHALRNNAPLGSIKLLVKGNPDAINSAEPDGLLPLQLACESCSLGAVKHLIGII
eukprot:scaffold84582_cov23-Cyclotella_meneghiniana.AAC.1